MLALICTLSISLAADDYAMIRTGTFHGDEMTHTSGDGWVGLYKTDDGYELRETSITVTAVKDQVIDEDDQMTGKRVEASSGDDAIYLFKGPGLAARSVKNVYDKSPFVYPGQTMSWKSGDGWFEITAVGTARKKLETAGSYVTFEGYELQLTERKGSEARGLVVTPESESWDDSSPMLIFVGDLDGDTRMDVILDPSTHYNVSNPTLLLSSAAGPDEVLKVVANLRTTGC